ncbi:MAG: hypothetical protein A2Y34_16150 [Spirochaetes bacterium GWC1_27_15]|nr:MAG: hypothetical protein A2Z98_03565 [Spirochaetes bacterium GWB1_27_13]OHD27173.1 MAG: hypothetical protein A2Y34_16150 [Spirochaetes bacterium GWC1_27_15]
MQFIDPRVDFAFKKIFGNENAKDILIDFLNSILGLEGIYRIKEVVILDPYQAPKIKYTKKSYVDVRCTDERNIQYIVEMVVFLPSMAKTTLVHPCTSQVEYVKGMEKRIIYNASKRYANQIEKGEDYPKLNQVISINILDFNMFEFPHYLSIHRTKETITGNCYLDEIKYYFIELNKFSKKIEELTTNLEKWIYFIKEASNLNTIPKELENNVFKHAFEIARVSNMSKEEWEAYDMESMLIQDERGMIEAALEKGEKLGVEKGKIEGEKLGIKKTAKNMKDKGLDINLICELTGLSIEDINKL